MKHYLNVFASLVRNNISREAEYRGNFFLELCVELGSLLIAILVLQIQFMYTDSLAGWSKGQVVLLIGVFKIVESLISFSFMRNLRRIPDYVERGELDHYLAKPISVQFLVSLRYLSFFKLSGLVVGLAVVVFTFASFGTKFYFGNAVLSLVVIGSGLCIFYSLFLAIASLSFWTTRLSAISNIYYTLKSPLSVPFGVFGNKARLWLTYAIPLAFVVTIPAGILIGREPVWYAPLSVPIACLFFLLSRWIWNIGLKRYSGASS